MEDFVGVEDKDKWISWINIENQDFLPFLAMPGHLRL